MLTRLVQGWEYNDGKTLFLVGDPMQSIYRFRQAEVGLFFRAKEQGIGPIKLTSLELRCNFRSTETIINWVNFHFSKIFPQQFDIESGAVSFHPSVNVIKGDESSVVHALKYESKQQEAKQLIEIIQKEFTANSEQSIAVLVRSRSQLTEIIKLLRQHHIPYQGTDIDLLANLEHLRDVWSLTQSLLNPGNRLAWLALLRSPYCGLSLQDIHHIAHHNPKKSIYSALLQLDKIPHLSEEGRTRAHYITQIMHHSLSQRYQNKLSDWVAKTLNQLHIEYVLTQHQLNDLEQFWILIDRYEQSGRLPDMHEFFLEFNKLYSQQSMPSRLHVMTIHKSKGLEFDTVILPGLGSKLKASDNPMLRWLKLPTKTQEDLLLVSPIKPAHHEHCPVYNYLNQLDEEKNQYEAQRVLYVAVTRAKARLYLFDSSSKTSKSSFRNLLKHQEFQTNPKEELPLSIENPLSKLYRLPINLYQEVPPGPAQFINPVTTGLVTGIPRLIGIIAHQLLQWICDHHPHSINEIPWELAEYEFKKQGFNQETRQSALALIKDQISRLFNDKTGLWIISKHEQEQNEYELLVEHQKRLATRIIDRMFIDNSKLWIIDFKTGKEEDSTLMQHRKQLNEYGYYLSANNSLPIYCGLYYLANNHWVEWQYEPLEALA